MSGRVYDVGVIASIATEVGCISIGGYAYNCFGADVVVHADTACIIVNMIQVVVVLVVSAGEYAVIVKIALKGEVIKTYPVRMVVAGKNIEFFVPVVKVKSFTGFPINTLC